MFLTNGDNTFTVEEIEKLFTVSDEQATPPAEGTTSPATQPTGNSEHTDESVEKTQAFAKRLREKSEQVRTEERESIAKSLGYTSYDDMIKTREKKMLEDKGLDPDEVSPIVEELVQKRLNEDPRLKELESYRDKQVQEFGKRELAEITRLTGGQITKFEQLSTEVVDEWKKTGSLKKAFLTIEGENLIMRAAAEQNRGSTTHIKTLNGTGSTSSTKRHLTDDEKRMWKLFNPHLTDEELNKKMIDK